MGGFIGSLYITNNNIKQQSSSSSVGALLLQQGFATLHDYSASQSTTYRDLVAAEKVAKDTRKGYWSIVDPATVEVEEVSSGSLRDQKIPTPVHELTVSEISSGGKIFIQVFSDGKKKRRKREVCFIQLFSLLVPSLSFRT